MDSGEYEEEIKTEVIGWRNVGLPLVILYQLRGCRVEIHHNPGGPYLILIEEFQTVIHGNDLIKCFLF